MICDRRGFLRRLAAVAGMSIAGWPAPRAAAEQSAATRLRELAGIATRVGLQGRILTVNGLIDPAQAGFALMHEHLFIDFFARFPWPRAGQPMDPELLRQMQRSGWSIPVTEAERRFFGTPAFTLDMVETMRRGARLRTDYEISSQEDVEREVAAYKEAGGKTIVDLTPVGLGRDPARLRRFAQANGIHVVMGTGWYRWPFRETLLRRSVDELAVIMAQDVIVGSGPQGIQSGIIGEIPLDSRSVEVADGPSAPFLPNAEIASRSQATARRLAGMSVAERHQLSPEEIYNAEELHVLRAAIRAARVTGAALSLHAPDPWLGYLPMMQAEGLPLSRVIIGHGQAHFLDRALLEDSLEKGVVLMADYVLQQYPTRSPLGPLTQLLDAIAWAVNCGHRDRVLLSLDLCNKQGQQRYGGGGYATLHQHVFPYLRTRGVSAADIDHIMIENPRRLLTLGRPDTVS